MRALTTLIAVFFINDLGVLQAQPMITPPPPSAGLRDPISLPGDNLPPPLPAMLAPPRAINPNIQRAQEPALPPAPPLELALIGAKAALAYCHTQGYEVGVAVANAQGGIVLGLQADAAHPGRVYNAMRKNLVAVAFGERSGAIRDRLRAKDYATLAMVQPNMTLFPGSIPLMQKGKLVGAIAVSGGPAGEVDETCAQEGAKAMEQGLK
ncbi:hypothetical protein EOE18_16855 [Novosphingobium umbonatum]|uniref:Heme-binding protein n=1 Tax=Novosphingobium umbonatum TaxID=1908524 RepID=A0A437N018_9SPHN|nr:heme-binding protein [Novosphingobium umbonatum]RVU03204.1 hypothetical protein EOE18_16855 [Novosphingobium umbonatum]